MPERTWKCDRCRETNPPFTEVCRSCGLPPSEEVQLYLKQAQEACSNRYCKPREPPLNVKNPLGDIYRFAEIRNCSYPTKCLAFLIWTVQLVAVIAFVLSFNLLHIALSVGVLVVTELIYVKMLRA